MGFNFYKKIQRHFKYGTVLFYLSHRLLSLGVCIKPYYLEHEGFLNRKDLELLFDPKAGLYEAKFLNQDDMKQLVNDQERNVSENDDTINDRIADGCLCFGVKHNDIIAATTWCDFKKCNFNALTFPLEDHEAYLFDTYTYKAYRGGNIASYMKYELYKHLNNMGRTRVYNITEALNTPSIKFKRKLKSKPISLYVYISLFDKIKGNFLIKKMGSGNPPGLKNGS